MLQIRDDGTFAEPNSLRIPGKETHINAVSEDSSSKQETSRILHMHSKVFEGIGRIRDNISDKELFIKFSMKPDAAPVAQKDQ